MIILKTKKVIIFALVFGLLSALSAFWYLQELEQQHSLPQERILIANREIPAHSTIEEDMLDWKEIPVDFVHPNALKDKAQVAGTVAKTSLVEGEQLLRDKLVTEDSYEDGLAYQVEPGYRAVSIAVSRVIAVSNLVKPGNKIDIVATLDLEVPGEGEEEQDSGSATLTTYVLQNLKVLATGQTLVPSQEGTEGDTSTMTLAVEASDAPKLVLASEKGSLRLLLRSPVDDAIIEVPPAEMKDLLPGDSDFRLDFEYDSERISYEGEGDLDVQN